MSRTTRSTSRLIEIKWRVDCVCVCVFVERKKIYILAYRSLLIWKSLSKHNRIHMHRMALHCIAIWRPWPRNIYGQSLQFIFCTIATAVCNCVENLSLSRSPSLFLIPFEWLVQEVLFLLSAFLTCYNTLDVEYNRLKKFRGKHYVWCICIERPLLCVDEWVSECSRRTHASGYILTNFKAHGHGLFRVLLSHSRPAPVQVCRLREPTNDIHTIQCNCASMQSTPYARSLARTHKHTAR